MPIAIIVQFDDYAGEELIPNHPKCIPLVPFKAQTLYRGKMRWRCQFPIRLSWAMTVHKSQGLTLEQAVIDIGKKDIGIGMTYVALSRLKGIQGLFFTSKPYSRFEKINSNTRLAMRKVAESDLRKKTT